MSHVAEAMNDAPEVTIYHNPACGTSRNTLALLQEHKIPHEVIKYLDVELNKSDYESFIEMIPDAPTTLIRRGQAVQGAWHFRKRSPDQSSGTQNAGQAPRVDAAPHTGQRWSGCHFPSA